MDISGAVAIKNGVLLGYPFIESILSLLPVCDEFVIVEGYSDDDTYFWLKKLQARYPNKIRLFRETWPTGLVGGRSIGEMQTRAIKKCRGRWVYLLQADEIMPEPNLAYLRQLCSRNPFQNSVSKLAKFTHSATPLRSTDVPNAASLTEDSPKRVATIRGHKIDLLALRATEALAGRFLINSYHVDFFHVVSNFSRFYFEGYRWAIRLARNRRGLYSDEDGWQLNGLSRLPTSSARLPQPIIHVGYNFPVNVWRKRINHARLYPESPPYQKAAREAEKQLRDYERGALPELSKDNPLNLPPLIAPLIGQYEYRVREELFD